MNSQSTVYIVDDDDALRSSLTELLEAEGFSVRPHATGEAFLNSYDRHAHGCVILDYRMPGLSGLEVQKALRERGADTPVLFLSGCNEVSVAVAAIKQGAEDFLLKPADAHILIKHVRSLVAKSHDRRGKAAEAQALRDRMATLSPREREILGYAIAGLSSKEIASRLSLSQRTVENHRLRINKKLGAGNLIEFYHRAARHGLHLNLPAVHLD